MSWQHLKWVIVIWCMAHIGTSRYLLRIPQVARGVIFRCSHLQPTFDIGDVEREWANVCLVDAHTILHRSTEVARAAPASPPAKSPMLNFKQASSGS